MMIYTVMVREKIRRDHEKLRDRSGGVLKLSAARRHGSADVNYYVVDYVNQQIDDLNDGVQPSERIGEFRRDHVNRANGLAKLDDAVVNFLIDYIDMHWNGDYRDVVDGYLAEPEIPEPVVPEREPEAISGHDPVNALRSFRERVDRFLTAQPFSTWLLSVHVSFAALYVFAAMALTWAIGGELDLGQPTPLLPGADPNVRLPAPGFDTMEVVERRFNILALVMVIVVIAFVGLISAAVRRADQTQRSSSTALLASATAPVNFAMLWLAGVDLLFSATYSVLIALAVMIAHRAGRRAALGYLFPFAIFLSVCAAVVVSLVHPSALAPGGILPVASFLVLAIGGLCGKERGGMAAAVCAVLFTALFAIMNAVYFPGWFRLDRWDPGTVTVFLILPFLNGFWDWLSLSATRRLAAGAIGEATAFSRGAAVLILSRAALIDTALALGFMIMLFASIELVTAAYNHFLHDGEIRSSVSAYFATFQENLFSARSVFVILIISTIILPTVVHVHAVSRAILIPPEREAPAGVRVASWALYMATMAAALILLLLLVRSAIDIVAQFLPTVTMLFP